MNEYSYTAPTAICLHDVDRDSFPLNKDNYVSVNEAWFNLKQYKAVQIKGKLSDTPLSISVKNKLEH